MMCLTRTPKFQDQELIRFVASTNHYSLPKISSFRKSVKLSTSPDRNPTPTLFHVNRNSDALDALDESENPQESRGAEHPHEAHGVA